ncbi:MAG: hypothetical protein JWR15_369 [Prosthecobacter sp.]|nr:hypothetical protein [Prosthecobacter sp.]
MVRMRFHLSLEETCRRPAMHSVHHFTLCARYLLRTEVPRSMGACPRTSRFKFCPDAP